ncbi:hypothetical protein C7I87_33720 [Mesorhizobium sp. SARCC-RB16n]|uniref:hypothetical protein n=1 Tax=Mesorhizobium sp. SARCC-RB16n TaxID=2116687 RepID=UPI00122F861E|nr:hypothetical protein [Mesorhizobium sp. SARCC-RB16n]KAA3441832.1 hypothetical protein C7I87_33720 [Mesorhizobium sp. SARCC-RB16n]
MRGSITARCCRLALGSAALLALTIAPYGIAFHGFVPGIEPATALAGKGGNGGGNNGNGNGNGGGNGNSGGGNSGDSGGNSGNGNGGGNNGNGNGNSGGNSDNGGGDAGSGKGQGDDNSSHVNATTGDKVDVDGSQISVQHPDGLTEKIENGRFRMKDALGRTIIDRRATQADVNRLKAL